MVAPRPQSNSSRLPPASTSVLAPNCRRFTSGPLPVPSSVIRSASGASDADAAALGTGNDCVLAIVANHPHRAATRSAIDARTNVAAGRLKMATVIAEVYPDTHPCAARIQETQLADRNSRGWPPSRMDERVMTFQDTSAAVVM